MRYLLILFLHLILIQTNAQTTAEWTKQKKTQIKYLFDQIAANRVYLEYIGKGYSIARHGLRTIQNIRNGDFRLHQEFIYSLSSVNPKIKNYSRIADIVSYQVRIIKNVGVTIKNLKESNQFQDNEISYAKLVFDNLLDECLKNIDELYLIITSNQLAMKDDERIKRIDKLYFDMQDKYSFCLSFSEDCSSLAMQRLSEQSEINMSKKLNGFE